MQSQPKFTVLTNVSVNDGTISKPSGGNGWNACAATTEGIESTQSQVRGVCFVVESLAVQVMVGLASDTSQRATPAYASIDFAAYLDRGALNVFEVGCNVNKGYFPSVGQVQVGDRVSVTLNNDNQVEFRVNGAWKYTSTRAPQFPLYLKVAMCSPDCSVREVRWILHETEAACSPDIACKECAIHKSALQAMAEEKVELEEELEKAKADLAKERAENKAGLAKAKAENEACLAKAKADLVRERADNEALRKKLAFRSKTQSDASHTKAEPEVEPTKQDGSR
mmetsp:Transcript_43105/g.97072  ORF Transcript_43105/g.97072 Transcript_43105/m.97072 type:complete len:282 (-) Transcript_43105:65-910(-)